MDDGIGIRRYFGVSFTGIFSGIVTVLKVNILSVVNFPPSDATSKQDIESLRQDMNISRSELIVVLIKWIAGELIAQVALIATLVKLL
jgi:hypothetical protein